MGMVRAPGQGGCQGRPSQLPGQELNPDRPVAATTSPVGRRGHRPIPEQQPGIAHIREAVAKHQQLALGNVRFTVHSNVRFTVRWQGSSNGGNSSLHGQRSRGFDSLVGVSYRGLLSGLVSGGALASGHAPTYL